MSLQEIKDSYAIKQGFDSWYDLYASCVFKINEFEKHTDKVCKMAQMECLKLASERLIWKEDKELLEDITDENNIIK